MRERQALRSLFCRCMDASFEVEYWNGDLEHYGGEDPKFRLILHDPDFVRKAIVDPEMAFAEAYVDGRFEIEGDLGDVIALAFRSIPEFGRPLLSGPIKMAARALGRRQAIRKAGDNVRAHYDLGNDFFRLWLDPSMSYSCAYFQSVTDSLEQAQRNKIDLILTKLRLKPGERLLDIGCGWGALALRAAGEYGASVTGITLAREQHRYAQEQIRERGLERRVDIKLMDYRELAESSKTFDAIASVGMMEHLGREHIPEFMRGVKKLLRPGGLALLHFITGRTEYEGSSWARTYIFPGGYIPSLRGVIHEAGDLDLRILDVQNLRPHYAMTLERWSKNFREHEDRIRAMYDDSFARMWWLYLCGSLAAMKYGLLEVHQVLCSSGVNPDLPLTREGWTDGRLHAAAEFRQNARI